MAHPEARDTRCERARIPGPDNLRQILHLLQNLLTAIGIVARTRFILVGLPVPSVKSILAVSGGHAVASADQLAAADRSTAAQIASEKFLELEKRHEHRTEVCQERVEGFETARKQSLQQMILSYQQSLLTDADMGIAIRRARSNIKRLETECDRRRNYIERWAHIRVDEPRLLSVAVILPNASGPI